MSQLLPCPFCGSDARRTPIHEIACSNFECKMHCVYFRFENAWNTRSPQKPCAVDVELAVKAYQSSPHSSSDNYSLKGCMEDVVATLSRQPLSEDEAVEVMLKATQDVYGNGVIAHPEFHRGVALEAYRALLAKMGG